MTVENSTPLQAAEAEVQAHSAGLRKELGLFDLVMAQVLLVIVLDFFGTAAKAGSAHVVFWLLAFVLFFIPLAMVVVHLNGLMPLEGGLYEWARLAFGDQIGFLVAWNLWLFVMLYVAVIGLVTTTFVAYALGPAAAWIASSRWLILVLPSTTWRSHGTRSEPSIASSRRCWFSRSSRAASAWAWADSTCSGRMSR